MNFRMICNEVKELAEIFSYDYNTEETRASIIEVISEHPNVGTVVDKTSQKDINDQVGKFSVQINGVYITITVQLL